MTVGERQSQIVPAPTENERWFSVLGGPRELQLLREVLPPDVALSVWDGESWLSSEEIDACQSHHDAADLTREVIDYACGVACLRFTDPIALRLGGLRARDPATGAVTVVIVAGLIEGDGKVLEDQFDEAHRLAREALPELAWSLREDDHVRRAMRLLGHGTSWTLLSSVLDVVRDDIGDLPALRSRGWVSRADLVRFYTNANAIEHSLAGGRHATARKRLRSPKDRMLLDRGRLVVRTIVTRWLEEKAAARPGTSRDPDRPPERSPSVPAG